MTKWEDPQYEVIMGSGPIGTAYKFKLVRNNVSQNGYYYTVAAVGTPPPHPFSGCVLLPQGGKPLIHYLPPDGRLNPTSSTYAADLELLLDEIVNSQIDAEPDSFERVVGFISIGAHPVNLFTLYKVENTHKNGELLVVVILKTAGASPGGSIGVIGR